MSQRSMQLIASVMLLSQYACTTTVGKVVVAPQPKVVIPTPLLTPPDDGGLSEELTEFLKSEAYRADQVSAYANLCQKFIKGLPQ